MQRTKDSKPLPLLFDPENIHRFFVLLLTLAATLVFWLESAATPPMVSHNRSPARRPAVARNHSATNLLCYDTPVPRLQSQAAELKTDNQNTADFFPESLLEKESGSNQRDLFQLIHKKLSANGQTGKWVDVAAGYGRICGVEPGIRENAAELEQPGRAYLKASFSF